MIWFLFLCLFGYFVYVLLVWNFHRRRMQEIKAKKDAEEDARERARQQREYERQRRIDAEREAKEQAQLRELQEKDPKAYEKLMYRRMYEQQRRMLQNNFSTSLASVSTYQQSVLQQSLQQAQVLSHYHSGLESLADRHHGLLKNIGDY